MNFGPFSLVILTAAALFFVAVALLVSKILAPTSRNAQKGEPYECGVPSRGPAWMQFRVGYYLFALLFLLFEVEVVFLFPWAVVVKEIGMIAFLEVLFFLIVLFMGLLYAWRKGVLKWI